MFVIVKSAKEGVWEYFYNDNPVLGVHPSHSCHNTFTGLECEIKPSYPTKEEAEVDCGKINRVNPTGNYAVCPLLDELVEK